MSLFDIAVFCLFTFTATAAAMNFSADIFCSGGQNGCIYISSDKMRTETDEIISIMRYDKKLVWILMLKKLYMEPIDKKQKHFPDTKTRTEEIERVFILREMVNAYDTEKYKNIAKEQDEH